MPESDNDDDTCGICLEKSRFPVTLSCGHQFCATCFDEWRPDVIISKERIDHVGRTCPLCRTALAPSKETISYMRHMRDHCDDPESGARLERLEKQLGKDWDEKYRFVFDGDVELPDAIITAIIDGDTAKA